MNTGNGKMQFDDPIKQIKSSEVLIAHKLTDLKNYNTRNIN